MANTPVTKLSELDFNQIKADLRNFLRQKPEMQDFDFEGAGWSYLIDLLAYNTTYNSFYLNMVASEMFLDSAQLKQSIVSKAKLLGYLPRSNRSATATIEVKYTLPKNPVVPSQIEISRDTAFSGVATDGTSYEFTLTSGKTLYLVNPSGAPSDYTPPTDPNADGGYFLTQLNIIEGVRLTQHYTVSSDPNQKFVIPNANVDTNSIVVTVQDSDTNSTLRLFTKAADITETKSDSKVYYIQQGADGLHEIYFGDGVISAGFSVDADGNLVINGIAPGNIVIIEYVICNGSLPNRIKTFSALAGVGSIVPVTASDPVETITTISQATGGEDAESDMSIKQFAPLNFEMQNRAVTKLDFEQLIKNDYPRIDSISVWGGENNIPPQYGRVFLSMKPSAGYILDNEDKDYIINSIVRKRCTVTQEPVIVDPEYIYLIVDAVIKFNYRETVKTSQELQYNIFKAISDYSNNTLEQFERGFTYSSFIELIDAVDTSINSNLTRVTLKKIIYPTLGLKESYDIQFINAIDIYDNRNIYGKAVYSTNFLYVNTETACFFAEESFGSTILSIFKIDNVTNSITKLKDVGTINYSTGEILINELFVPTGWINNMNHIEFYAKPKVLDVDSARNVILVIDDADIHVTVEKKS